MKGFELHINGKVIKAAPKDGSVSIIATCLKMKDRDENHISFTGYNGKNNNHFTWLDDQMEIGDEFSIKVVDVQQNSIPTKSIIEEDPEGFLIKYKLDNYKVLKEELEGLGLI